jgi:hypothetical protein
VAFVRGGGLEAGHLLPVPRTREALGVLAGNVRLAQAELGVPLALEHVAAVLEWPAPELDEAAFLTELLERTGALLLLDLANLHANARNHGGDPLALLDALPLERIAYVHVAGGVERDGLYHDTHAHPTPPPVLELLAELCARTVGMCSAPHAAPNQTHSLEACAPPPATTHPPQPRTHDRCSGRDSPGVMLERDDAYPPEAELAAELAAIAAAPLAGAARRPPTARGGALADGLAFARALARQGGLSPDARVEAMLAAAALSARPVRLAATLAGPPRRLVVTVRAPGLGERWLTVPLG